MGIDAFPSAQLLESRQTVGPQHNRLAVDREALGLDALCCCRDGRQPRRPVIAIPTIQSHRGTIPTDDDPVTVVLNLVNPFGAGR